MKTFVSCSRWNGIAVFRRKIPFSIPWHCCVLYTCLEGLCIITGNLTLTTPALITLPLWLTGERWWNPSKQTINPKMFAVIFRYICANSCACICTYIYVYRYTCVCVHIFTNTHKHSAPNQTVGLRKTVRFLTLQKTWSISQHESWTANQDFPWRSLMY